MLVIACVMSAPVAAYAGPPGAVKVAGQSAPAAKAPSRGAPAAKASARGAPAAKAPADEARELFAQGVAAHDAGKLAAAEGLFTRAWGLQRSWDVAANLGIVERKLHRDAAAAEHLSFALAALPPSESEKTRKGLARELEAAAAKAGKLTIRSGVAGAVVRVGGRLRGTAPLDGPVFEAPGQVRIEVSKDGFTTATQVVSVEAGGAVEVTLSPAPKVRSERSLVAPGIAFGAAGLGLLTGLVAGGIAAATMEDLRKACGPDLVCPERLRDQAGAGRAAAHVGTVGFVTAGVGAAVGVTLLLVPDKGSPARVGITVGPGFLGVKGEL